MDKSSQLHWIKDHKIGINYILVKGPQTEQIVEILKDKLDDISSKHILVQALTMQDKSPIVRNCTILGIAYLGWNEFIPSLRILASDHEPDEAVRQDAALLVARLVA